jgi:hypothetical protein
MVVCWPYKRPALIDLDRGHSAYDRNYPYAQRVNFSIPWPFNSDLRSVGRGLGDGLRQRGNRTDGRWCCGSHQSQSGQHSRAVAGRVRRADLVEGDRTDRCPDGVLGLIGVLGLGLVGFSGGVGFGLYGCVFEDDFSGD